MGVREAVANQLARWMGLAVRAIAPPRYGAVWAGGQAVWSEWDAQKAVKKGYKASYIFYTVASDLADCQRSMPWVLRKKTDRGSEIVDKHPLVSMIRRPNPEQTWGALMELWDLDKSLAGNAYGLWGETGDTVAVWRLRPDRVGVKLDEDRHIAKYTYDEGKPTPKLYDPEQILHFKFADPGDDHFGMAPLKAAAKLVDTSNEGITWNYGAMKNRALPPLMFNPKRSMTPEQWKAAMKLFKEQMTGSSNARKSLVLAEPWDVETLALTPVEMDFLASFVTYEAGVCKVLHVHPEAIGALGATFENKEWAINDKWGGPVKSRAYEVRAVENHKFGPVFGTVDPRSAAVGDLYLDVDMSDTPDARAARLKRLEQAPKIWAIGKPFNELNEEMNLGFEPTEGGDVGYVPANMLPGGMPSVEEGRSVRAFDPDGVLDLHYRATDRKRQGWERGVTEKVKGLFAVEGVAVAAAVKGGKTSESATDAVIEKQTAAWDRVFVGVYQGVIKDFGEQVAEEISPPRTRAAEYEFDPWTPTIKKYVATKVAGEIELIQATTKAAIRRVVQAGFDKGLSMPEIARNIRSEYKKWESDVGVYRSMRIARTEVHNAAGYGMHESARQSGVAKKKHWLDAGDDRVREGHVANTGAGWIDFDGSYPDGAIFPGDGTDDVNCRCAEMYKSR